MIKKENKDKKVLLQQKIIQKLENEISLLKDENANLKEKLSFEQDKPKESYEKAKKIISDVHEQQLEYDLLICELRELKDTYKEKLDELSNLKSKYQHALDVALKETKRNIKKSKKL